MSANAIQGEIPSKITVLTRMSGEWKVVTSSSIRWSKAIGAIRPKAVDSLPLGAGTVVAERRVLESGHRLAQPPLFIVLAFAGCSAARAPTVLPGVDHALGIVKVGDGDYGFAGIRRASTRPDRLPLHPAAPEEEKGQYRPQGKVIVGRPVIA
jgi:hypothetical protein